MMPHFTSIPHKNFYDLRCEYPDSAMRLSNHQALYQRCQWDPAHANTHWLWHHRNFVSLVGKLWQGDYKAKARTYWWKIYTTYLPKRNQSSNFNEATLQVIPTYIGVSFPWSVFAFLIVQVKRVSGGCLRVLNHWEMCSRHLLNHLSAHTFTVGGVRIL